MDYADLSKISVLIPTLNEEKAIGPVIDEVVNTGIPRENILVIDGGSTDNTVVIAYRKGVRVYPQEGRGKALAIKTGLKYVNTPYVLVMDGDWTYPAKYIPRLYEKMLSEDCDLVVGARVYGRKSQKLIFKLGNKVITWIFNMLFGTQLRDVLSGMYIAKTETLREVNFEMSGFSVESEIVAHFATVGKVCEESIEYRERLDPSAKKLRVVHGFKIALDILRLTWRYSPVFLIFAIGSLLLIPGLLLGAWVAYHYFFTGIKYYVRGIIAIVLAATGLLSLNSALMALYVRRIELRVHRKLNEIAKSIKKSS
ncbi:MAG: glycosyltransferase family 2 protein [Desulfurococcaceae archaeon]